MRSVRADRLRAVWWPAAAALALLAAAQWLNGTSVQYLVTAGLATAVALAGLRVVAPRGRVWAAAATVVLSLVVLVAGLSQWKLYRIDEHWPDVRAALTSDAMAALDQRVDQAVTTMQDAAHRALGVPGDTAAAFDALARLVSGPGGGIVLYNRGMPLAWAGHVYVPTDSLADSVGVARSSFYTSLYAVAAQDGRRVVVTQLLDAHPPADRLTQPVAGQIAGMLGIQGFQFDDTVPSANGAPWQPLRADTQTLMYARVEPLARGAVRVDTVQSARLIVALSLALALICFLIAAWRVGRRFRWRLVTVAVALACTALVPLNMFSSYSRLFDPGLYYTPIGGALTANAGALMITAVLVLLALMALVRRLARRQPRAWWGLAVLAIAGLGPFLLRDLARGITIPFAGVNASLWLIWEVPIFLAGCAVLLAGATAGSAALGPTRGAPPWVGPAIASVAALLAPVTWQAAGRWPWWYPIPWIVAIGALALSRRSRAIVSSAAAVAALGATTLVWGATTRGRMVLAEQDVRSLGANDRYVVSLVERFAASVRSGGPPSVSRRWLLRAYANSALVQAGGYPAWLSIWTGDSVPAAVLRTSSAMRVSLSQVRAIVAQTLATDSTVEYPIIAQPAVQFGVGIPMGDTVVAVVAASRTRLIPADPYAKLLGIDQPAEAEPPYVLQLGEPPTRLPTGPPAVEWRRQGTTLRGDWIARTTLGASRVHIDVELRSVDALIQRGSLVVLFDLAIVGVLWLVSVLADGAVGRWLRDRQRRWRRSYRTQLTLALFGFFMVPAMAFAAWSYGEIASDATQGRGLLVGETLRAVLPVPDSQAWLAAESQRLDAPLFLYRDGELADASDSLLAALAPTGRFLPPAVQLGLVVRDEVSETRDESFGDSQALFGFRAVDDPQGPIVLAAPARANDLSLDRRRRDLGILVLFSTVVGAIAAFGLSGLVARGLAGPIRSLRQAALALAAGGRASVLDDSPTVEFRPVFSAFRRMATDLEASRTATAHAQRVLAWGEMARQVAHEIKNPLTPIRLGVQHLQRARHDPRVDFDRVLDENVERILAEIDHLDEIARAFSRYGAPPNARPAGEPTDVAAVVRDLIGLERMGEERIQWELEGADGHCLAIAQRDELREVLLNLYENARLAGAHTISTLVHRNGLVVIEVRDDGHGIPADVLPRVFEPHFSTRTSGSGLGLAISRQLLEGWGGTIDVESWEGKGSLVRITLAGA